MSATNPQKRVSAHQIQKLGIIAGGGSIPALLCHACVEQGIEPVVVGIHGCVADDLRDEFICDKLGLGQAGKMMDVFRVRDVSDIVMIGGVGRPRLSSIKPDLRAAKFLAKIGVKAAMGDNTLLSAVKSELEKEGFNVHGAHEFLNGLLTPKGAIGALMPEVKHEDDIQYGMRVARTIGALDIGQAVIVENGITLGVEGVEGTDALIERCSALRKGGAKPSGILVKLCKPQQDKSLDLPTVGLQTVKNCIEAGFDGLVIEAGRSFLLDREAITAFSDEHKFFVYGVDGE